MITSAGGMELRFGYVEDHKGLQSKVKVVEVKSTNDQLNDQQGAWLSTLRDVGVDAILCRVSS